MLLQTNTHKKTAGGVFVPTDISDIEVWYDASDTDTITEVSDKVSQLDDKSGNGNHATQTTGSLQPLTNTDTINGLNCLSPAGAEYMNTGVFPRSTWSTVFCVGKTPATFHNIAAMFGCHDNSNHRYYAEFLSNGKCRYGMGNGSITPSHVFTANDDVMLVGHKYTSNLIDWYDRGVKRTTDSHGFSGTSTDDLKIMARTFNVNIEGEYDGLWCEFIRYTKTLSTAELNDVGNYLATKWGMSWTTIV